MAFQESVSAGKQYRRTWKTYGIELPDTRRRRRAEHVKRVEWKTGYDESAKLFDKNLQNS